MTAVTVNLVPLLPQRQTKAIVFISYLILVQQQFISTEALHDFVQVYL
jgi:hypothetical protein